MNNSDQYSDPNDNYLNDNKSDLKDNNSTYDGENKPVMQASDNTEESQTIRSSNSTQNGEDFIESLRKSRNQLEIAYKPILI